jgi:hypothetical protein
MASKHGYRTSGQQGGNHNRPDHMNLRRRLKKKAQEQRNREMEWKGGVLYFKGTADAVPGVLRVPKPGRPTTGHERGLDDDRSIIDGPVDPRPLNRRPYLLVRGED